jgi:Methyltransferase domain
MTVEHWEHLYATRRSDTVGWYEADPVVSRGLVDAAVTRGARSVIDIGGGASRLVDHLLDLDLDRIAVLDIAEAGLAVSRARLGARAERVEWIVADVTAPLDLGRFDVWHDRAVFHFVLDAAARRRYVGLAQRTIPPGGLAIMATFADDGPERCSGLPVCRYEPEALARECGPAFRLTSTIRHLHHTPAGVPQAFQYSTFERVAVDLASRQVA